MSVVKGAKSVATTVKGAKTQASKVAKAIKKTVSVKQRKVHYTCRFHRKKPQTLPLNPKYARKSVPHLPRMHDYRVIRNCVTTESAMKEIEEKNTLVFLCDSRANKTQIKMAVKNLYGVDVRKVNTLIKPNGQKKAYVRLQEGSDALDVANRIGLI